MSDFLNLRTTRPKDASQLIVSYYNVHNKYNIYTLTWNVC